MLALLSSAYLFSECGRRVLHSDQFSSQYTPHLEAVSFAPRILIVVYTLRSSASLSASRCHFSTLEMYQVIDDMVQSGKASVRVLPTHDRWFGVTYQQDKDAVIAAFRDLYAKGEYNAENLYKK